MRSRSKSGALVVIFALFLSLFLPNSYSAQKITAGSSCKGLNKKVDYKNKTYTCIKKGNKLVWSKGAVIKSAAPAASPSPTPAVSSPAIEAKVDSLSLDPRVSKDSLLSSASICKTIDKTPDYGPGGLTTSRNGFPRPKEATYPSGKAKVLVIPFTYTTWPFLSKLPAITNRTVTDLEAIQKVNKEVEELAKSLSAGKFEMEISILPESEWLTLDPELGFDSTPMTDNFGPINKGVICMCTKDLYYQQFDMDKSMLDEYKDKWLKKVDQYFKSNS